MPNATSNLAVVNYNTRHFCIITVVASEVSETNGKIASIACLVSHYCNVANIYTYCSTVDQQCEASCTRIVGVVVF